MGQIYTDYFKSSYLKNISEYTTGNKTALQKVDKFQKANKMLASAKSDLFKKPENKKSNELPSIPKDIKNISDDKLMALYNKRKNGILEFAESLQNIKDPKEKMNKIKEFAAKYHEPMDMYALNNFMNKNQDYKDLFKEMKVERKENSFTSEPAALTRIMLKSEDDDAFLELGSQIREKLGSGATSESVVKEIGKQMESLALQTANSWGDYSAMGYFRSQNKTNNPVLTLSKGNMGACGEWAHAQYNALQGAFINSDIVYAAPAAGVPGLENIYNHGAAAYQGSDGNWYVMDIWQYGKEHGGNINNFENSNYNGKITLKQWYDKQISTGKLFMKSEYKIIIPPLVNK